MKTDRQLKAQPIRCPHCGWEYHPSEVFLPGEIFGKPDAIVKDPLGKILCEDYREDDEPSPVERFECENCGKPIVVEATLTFKAKKEDEELDFTEEYASLLAD